MRETLLLDVLHYQVVFTIPSMLRIFFEYKPKLRAFQEVQTRCIAPIAVFFIYTGTPHRSMVRWYR